MAVSRAQINELRSRQDALRREIENVHVQINSEQDRLVKENNERLEALLAESAERLEARDEQIRAEYGRLLEQKTSEQEQMLSQNLRVLEEQYRAVCGEVNGALEEERRRTEEILIKQRNFEEAYNMQRELARATAQASLEQARAFYEQLSCEPLDWFKSGHSGLCRTQLGEIKRLMDMELYESAAAVADNMLLSMQMDMIEMNEMFRRWSHYYQFMNAVTEAERKLIFESLLKLPEELERFRAAHSEDTDGGRISEELADRWLDGGFEKLKETYRRDLDMLRPFRDKYGKAAEGEKKIKAVMLENPDISANFSETHMYRSAAEVMRHRDDAEKARLAMFGRMAAFEQRLELANGTIEALSGEAGYTLLDLPPFGSEGETGVFSMTFSDSNNVHTVDVMIVPVKRYADGQWTNHAVWFYSDGTGESTVNALSHILADVFVKERKIPLSCAAMRVNQTRDERIKLACSEMQLMTNMRLN